MRQHNGQNGQRHGGGNNGGPRRHNNNQSQVPLRNQNFDSHGPENTRVRGNAMQVYEKYMQLARDATERVDAENYYQHAEHYYRIVEAIAEHEAEQRARYQQSQPAVEGGEQPPMQSDAPVDSGAGEQPTVPADPFAPTSDDTGPTSLTAGDTPSSSPSRRGRSAQ